MTRYRVFSVKISKQMLTNVAKNFVKSLFWIPKPDFFFLRTEVYKFLPKRDPEIITTTNSEFANYVRNVLVNSKK